VVRSLPEAARLARSANPTRGKAILYPPTADRYFLYWVGSWRPLPFTSAHIAASAFVGLRFIVES